MSSLEEDLHVIGAVSGVDLAIADVGERDVRVGSELPLVLRLSSIRTAGSTGDARLGRIRVDWVLAVQPEHAGGGVVPKTHDEGHSLVEGTSELGHATELLVGVGVGEEGLGSSAEVVGETVEVLAGKGGGLVLNDSATLDVLSADLFHSAVVSAVLSDELSDNSDWLGGVDLVLRARSVEVGVAVSELSEVTAIFIAGTVLAISTVTALQALASGGLSDGARVSSVGLRLLVGLPDVHLHAARSVLAGGGRGVPALNVGLTSDELDVVGALSVTVTSTVLGSGLVARVLGHATISIECSEVEGTVEAARQVAHIHVKGELSVLEFELLVSVLAIHEVSTSSNVGTILRLSDVVKAELVAFGGDTIGVSPGVLVDSVKSASLGARLVIGAVAGVPLGASVAVGVAASDVSPPPVGIQDDLASLRLASTGLGACLIGQRQVVFLGLGSDLLGGGDCDECCCCEGVEHNFVKFFIIN